MFTRAPLQAITNTTADCSCCYCEPPPAYMETTYCTVDENSYSQSYSVVAKKRPTRRSKHVPHHLRPQHVVERRNRRERLRVQDVNQAFHTLQQLLPVNANDVELDEPADAAQHSSRISKARTLRKAADYIEALQNLLNASN